MEQGWAVTRPGVSGLQPRSEVSSARLLIQWLAVITQVCRDRADTTRQTTFLMALLGLECVSSALWVVGLGLGEAREVLWHKTKGGFALRAPLTKQSLLPWLGGSSSRSVALYTKGCRFNPRSGHT